MEIRNHKPPLKGSQKKIRKRKKADAVEAFVVVVLTEKEYVSKKP